MSLAPPAPWAARSGVDGFGAFADLDVSTPTLQAVQRFRWCPPGACWMGSAPDDRRDSSAADRTRIEIERGFWLADTPVTQAFYVAVMGRNSSSFIHHFSLDLPANMLSIHDSTAFINSLNARVRSQAFWFPTSEGWAYAARAGLSGDIEEGVTWHDGNSFGRPHSVGQKQPNSWGIFDVLGNVTNWTENRNGQLLASGGSWRSSKAALYSLGESLGVRVGSSTSRLNIFGLRLAAEG